MEKVNGNKTGYKIHFLLQKNKVMNKRRLTIDSVVGQALFYLPGNKQDEDPGKQIE